MARRSKPVDWSIVVAIVSAVVAIASWATSARKSRVDNLVQIIDAQGRHIAALERDLREAKVRISELEVENRLYCQLLRDNGIEVTARRNGGDRAS